jgi:hypothetical protein
MREICYYVGTKYLCNSQHTSMRKLLFMIPVVVLLASGCSSSKVTTQALPPTGNMTYSGPDFSFQYPGTMTVHYPSTMTVSDTIYTSHGEQGCGSAWANSSYCLYLDPTTGGTGSDPLHVFVYKTNTTPKDYCDKDVSIRLGICMSTEINGYPAATGGGGSVISNGVVTGSDNYYSFISHDGTLAIIASDDSTNVAQYTIVKSISFHN